MRNIILASSNTHKIKEFKEIFYNDNVLSLDDINYHDEINENGCSFFDNALIKAKTIHEYIKDKYINFSVIADDSGLCVDSLNGAPGIYSARYSLTSNSGDNRKKLLKELENKENRKAHFTCCLVEYFPNGEFIHVEGKTYGYILDEETGDTSFGYDCLFYSTDLNKSFGLATSEEKNSVSHRYRAIQELLKEENIYYNKRKKTEISISKKCGLCYGSNNAINKTNDILEVENNVVLYKEILHNKNVMKRLKESGASLKNSLNEITSNDYVIIRAHGEPLSTFQYFKKNKINYLDCTCPNVKTIHLLVKEKNELGYKIIIIGKKNHPEVIATSGWCSSPILIENENDIKNINLNFEKYFLVVQTTFSKDTSLILIDEVKKALESSKKIFEYKNTICNAQKLINEHSIELANKVDIMIVIGGKNSSNSIELFNKMRSIVTTYFIEDKDQLLNLIEENKILPGQKIGITAGASTLNEDIINAKKLLENKFNLI